MSNVILTRDLSRRGFDANELKRMTRAGDLDRIRRGAYAMPSGGPGVPLDRHDELIARHRLEISATVAQLHPRALVSHGSAAVLHGLPVFEEAIRRVHITRDRSGGGVRRSFVQVHGAPLATADFDLIEGVPTTSLARTVSDLARSLSFAQAVAIGDAALRLGLDAADLAAAIEWAHRWRGSPQARRVAGFIDGRSESVGESYSRVGFDRDGVPKPELQYEVFDDAGLFVGRSDFGWEALRTLGEFDGKQKYLRYRREGESLEDFLIREKQREDALRDLGWQVVRWMWPELFQDRVIAERLERAFARARRYL